MARNKRVTTTLEPIAVPAMLLPPPVKEIDVLPLVKEIVLPPPPVKGRDVPPPPPVKGRDVPPSSPVKGIDVGITVGSGMCILATTDEESVPRKREQERYGGSKLSGYNLTEVMGDSRAL